MMHHKVDPNRLPIGHVQPQKPAGQTSSQAGKVPLSGQAFQEMLREELTGVKFSAHALARLRSRGIELTPQDLSRLGEAVNRAETKGARESLVLMDDRAFVVSVKNRTVITAMDGEARKENVFTNIDSAVIT